MSLIEKLVALRIAKIMREFDIIMTDYGIYSPLEMRKIKWLAIKRKIFRQKYVNDCDMLIYYLDIKNIKNIIWKNIMSYDIINKHYHIYMYHTAFSHIKPVFRSADDDILNGGHNSYNREKKNNCEILQTKIINYMMLIDILVRDNMICDLSPIFKAHIFDVILIL